MIKNFLNNTIKALQIMLKEGVIKTARKVFYVEWDSILYTISLDDSHRRVLLRNDMANACPVFAEITLDEQEWKWILQQLNHHFLS